MNREQIKAMVLGVITSYDYDAYKSLVPELAEEPEFAEQALDEMIDIAESHINEAMADANRVS